MQFFCWYCKILLYLLRCMFVLLYFQKTSYNYWQTHLWLWIEPTAFSLLCSQCSTSYSNLCMCLTREKFSRSLFTQKMERIHFARSKRHDQFKWRTIFCKLLWFQEMSSVSRNILRIFNFHNDLFLSQSQGTVFITEIIFSCSVALDAVWAKRE